MSAALADAYDPPANYYATATGTGTTLKQQLNDIIDNHTVLSYDSARSNLQITDADPNAPGRMLTVYDRTSVNVAAINPGGSIPGWDGAATWNREHTWPASRGVGSSGADSSDLFLLRPALTANNGDRGNINFGGAFGQPYGVVTESGIQYWYPGDADAGMIAREQFYLAVRYDGNDANTTDLELFSGNPTTSQGLGNLDRLLQWHYQAPPDAFERRRNQIIYDNYQHNRDPFTDRPEYAWSIFANQNNDTQLALAGATVGSNGGTALNVNLGRVIVGGAVPAAQSVTLNKTGTAGTYYQVTTAGSATSSVTGRYNAFAMGGAGAKGVTVGLTTTTSTAGLKSGAVTFDNLDVTTGSGLGRGAQDANDVANVSLSVLDHARPSFNALASTTTLAYDFGSVAAGAAATFSFDLYNLMATAGYTAGLDLDGVTPGGQSSAFTVDVAPFTGLQALQAGDHRTFHASLTTPTAGQYSASYTFAMSDENLAGATGLGSLQLLLTGTIVANVDNADFDASALADGADFLIWQRGAGATSGGARSTGDANGDAAVNGLDLAIWTNQFGQALPVVAATAASVPEPASLAGMTILAGATTLLLRRKRLTFA